MTLAKRYTAEANEHVALAQAYRGSGSRKPLCITTISQVLSRDAAKEATAAAEMHQQLAGVGR